jgi:hypothetical protein
MYGEVKALLHAFLTTTSDRNWLSNSRCQCFIPRKRSLVATTLHLGSWEDRSQCGRSDEGNLPCPCRDSSHNFLARSLGTTLSDPRRLCFAHTSLYRLIQSSILKETVGEIIWRRKCQLFFSFQIRCRFSSDNAFYATSLCIIAIVWKRIPR